MTVPPAPVRVPSQSSLAPSVMSVANDKGDNWMIPGAVHRSPDIYLTAEENPEKPEPVDRLMKAVRPVIPSNEVRRIARYFRNGIGRKEGTDGWGWKSGLLVQYANHIKDRTLLFSS